MGKVSVRLLILTLALVLGMLSFLTVESVQGQDPSALVEEGDQLLLESDFAGAEAAYDAAIAADPQSGVAYAHRCYLRLFQERYDEALADCQQAVALAPNEAEGYIYLTRAYDWNGEFAAAVEAGEQAVALSPENGLAQSFLGEAYIDAGAREVGEAAIRRGAELAPDEPEVHRNMAFMYGKLRDTDAEFAELEIAISLAPRFTPYYRQVAVAHYGLDQPERALDYFQQMQAVAQEAGNRSEEARAINGIGAVHLDQWQHSKALEYFEKALSIYREVGDRRGELKVVHNIGVLYKSSGQFLEALEYLEEALLAYREFGDQSGEQAALWNIGIVYNYMGKYQEALKYHQDALDIRRDLGYRAAEQASLINIGAIYANLGQHQQALQYYEESLNLSREIGARGGEAVALCNIGSFYYRQGMYQEALLYYEQALSINKGNTTALNNMGVIYTELGQYQKALGHLEEALTLAQTDPDVSEDMFLLNSIGEVYSKEGQYEQALSYYERALRIAQGIGVPEKETLTLDNIGQAYYGLGDKEKALDYYLQALAVYEEMRGQVTVEELKIGYAEIYQEVYERTISLLIELGRGEDAFHYGERARARTFLDQLGNIRVNPLTTDNPALVEEEEALRGEINALDVQLRAERAKPPNRRSQEFIQSIEAQLTEKRETYAQLLVRLKLDNPQYASLVTVNTLTLTEIQRLLTNTTLVEYYVLPKQTLAFVVTQDSFHAEIISVTRESLYEAIDGFKQETRATLSGVPASLQRLYDTLIAPIEAHLTTRQLFIVPHAILHYVPFAALNNGEAYLIENHTLAQLPSASILPFILDQRKVSISPPLVLGDPDGSLSFGRREAQAVAELYGVTAHVGDEALERLVWEQGADAGILHLATHGDYDEGSPLFSCVLLATDAATSKDAGEAYDGVLEVHEVYNLDLHNADLVVLSACQTNLGEQSAGDEVVGLNRAFIYAGSPSVIASLWSVDDAATKDLMTAFYRYLKEGRPKGEALRQAQVDSLQNPDTAHPYYWAGFVLTGDAGDPGPGPTETPTPSGEDDSGGGFCPGAALPLTLVAIVGILVTVRKPHR